MSAGRVEPKSFIKVLPDEFSNDADRIVRFPREAEVLAALNHPHIASIYDLATIDASKLLILEFVDGETLDDRIKHGPLPIRQGGLCGNQWPFHWERGLVLTKCCL
jgi:serine/threonine protein kinase